MDLSPLVEIYADMMSAAVPVAIVIWICDIIATTICRAAFTGWLSVRVK